jgi:hypothetical protein
MKVRGAVRVLGVCLLAVAVAGTARTTRYFTDILSSDELASLRYWEPEDSGFWSLGKKPVRFRMHAQLDKPQRDLALPGNLLCCPYRKEEQ